MPQMRIDVDVQKERYKMQEEKLLEREAGLRKTAIEAGHPPLFCQAGHQEHARLIQSLRSDLEEGGTAI